MILLKGVQREVQEGRCKEWLKRWVQDSAGCMMDMVHAFFPGDVFQDVIQLNMDEEFAKWCRK